MPLSPRRPAPYARTMAGTDWDEEHATVPMDRLPAAVAVPPEDPLLEVTESEWDEVEFELETVKPPEELARLTPMARRRDDTAKMPPFQLATALAALTADEE